MSGMATLASHLASQGAGGPLLGASGAGVSPSTRAGCSVAPSGNSVHGLCIDAHSLHIPIAYRSIAPVLVLAGGALVLLLISSLLSKRSRPGLYAGLTLLIGAGAVLASCLEWVDIGDHGPALTIGQQIAYDRFSVLIMLLVGVATVLGALVTDSYLQREGLDGVEAYVLMLLAGSGAMLMAESAGLIMVFLGLEIMSISLYVMAAYHRRRRESGEAGFKYFILGSFSSAIFLYGVALVYGATGSTQFSQIGSFLARNSLSNNGVLLAGMALLIVGLGFKVAAVPFHVWSPDVYQGSPTPFTGYMAAVAKAAGFAALLRVLLEGLPTQEANWRPAIWLIAVLTLFVGSVLAIAQKDLKRMLAYSSISQAGYVLIGVQAGSARGTAAVLFYLFTYTFIIIGTFAVVGVIQGEGERRNDLGAIRGLARRRPTLAAAMLVLLLAQAGVPLTSGFLAKFYVIEAVLARGQYPLAVIGMLAAAVAAFFYLRVALLMYATPGRDGAGLVGAGTLGGAGGPAGNGTAVAGDVEGARQVEDTAIIAGLAPVPSLDAPPAASGVPVGTIRAGGAPGGSGSPAGAPVGAARSATGATVVEAASTVVEPAPPAARPEPEPVVLDAPPAERVEVPAPVGIALVVCVVFTIFAGVTPPVIDFAKHATMIFG